MYTCVAPLKWMLICAGMLLLQVVVNSFWGHQCRTAAILLEMVPTWWDRLKPRELRFALGAILISPVVCKTTLKNLTHISPVERITLTLQIVVTCFVVVACVCLSQLGTMKSCWNDIGAGLFLQVSRNSLTWADCRISCWFLAVRNNCKNMKKNTHTLLSD